MFELTTISLVLFITSVFNLLIFFTSWQRRKRTGGYYFAFGMLASTLWVLAAAFDYAAVPITLKVFFAKFETLFYNSTLILIFVYFLIYVGYEDLLEKRRVRLTLWGIPFINISLAVTNDWHHLYWTGFTRNDIGENILIFHHGPAFGWVAVTGYLIIAMMIGGLVYRAYVSTGKLRRQAIILIAAIFIPIISNLLYLIEIPRLAGIDWTSISFSLFGVVILQAIYGTNFLDIVPIARRSIIERMSDPILVLDQQQMLVDFNLAAEDFFGFREKSKGRQIADLFPEYPKIVQLALLAKDTLTTFELKDSKAQKYYFDVEVTILRNKRDAVFAQVIVFHDISQRHRTEELLKERLEEIGTLNESLREAQEKVIEQTRLLAKIEERERLGRDLHDSVNQSIHSVMLSSETLEALLANGQVDAAIHVAERIRISGLQALKEIRLLLYEIASPFKSGEANFMELMETRLKMVERRVGIRADIEVLNQEKLHCSPERIENLYWLAIEALNNSLKYAQASKLIIRLNCTTADLIVEIEDNGVGFVPEKLKSGGLGMRTMRERAELLGGALAVESAPNAGTKIRFWAKIEK